MPEYLYHYTSINTLALILSTKSIKLSPLNSVDDLTETLSADEVNFGQYVFVTCWTSDEEESIPFWKMYTPDMTGVRLKFPKKMFQEYEFYSIPHMGIRAIEGHTYADQDKGIQLGLDTAQDDSALHEVVQRNSVTFVHWVFITSGI